MSHLRILWKRVASLFGRDERDAELAGEIEFHVELQTQDNMHAGMTPEEARRQALIKLGGMDQTKESYRDRRGLPWLDSLLQDIRFALRMLRKNPGFTATLALIFAVGIGGATATYAIARSILLRPLPFPHAEQLALLSGITYLDQVDRLEYWAHNPAFDHLAEYRSGGANLSIGDHSDRISASVVSASFFPILGIPPEIGRTFLPQDEVTGKNHVAVLSHAFWEANFDGNADALGETILLNGTLHTIVGVMPRRFDFPPGTSVWVPRIPRNGPGQLDLGSNPIDIGQASGTFGRLKPGVSITRATDIVNVLAQRLQNMYGDAHHRVIGLTFVRPMQQTMVRDVRLPLITLLVAVLFLLLIVCANAANMLLARGALRQKEVAVRLCLGASRFRIVRQLVTESLILTLSAAVLGILLSRVFLVAILAITPPKTPRLAEVSIDPNVLATAVAFALVTGILVGLVPALETLAPQLTRALKQESYRATGGMHGALRKSLIVGEIAVSVMLLSGAALTIRSLYRMMQTPLGFNPENVVTMDLDVSAPARESLKTAASQVPMQTSASSTTDTSASRASMRLFYEQLLDRVRSVPGVLAAGESESIPLKNAGGFLFFSVEGHANSSGRPTEARVFDIAGDYFRAMGVPIVNGRSFTDEEMLKGGQVVIVNQSLARTFWPGRTAVGQRISIPRYMRPADYEIVGVAGDLATLDASGMQNFNFYLPAEGQPGISLVARTGPAPETMIEPVRDAVIATNHDIAVYNARTMDSVLSAFTAAPRFRAILLGVFACMALCLAAFGVYGAVAYSVACRTHEIGVRVALGAKPHDVDALILGEGLRLAIAGTSLGVILSLGLGRLLQTLLFGTRASDPASMIFSAGVLLISAAIASYLPARRASRIDPLIALRYE